MTDFFKGVQEAIKRDQKLKAELRMITANSKTFTDAGEAVLKALMDGTLTIETDDDIAKRL